MEIIHVLNIGFTLLGIALLICLITIQILLENKNPDELYDMPKDIKFTGLLEFDFTEENNAIPYSSDNLGTTGNPIFDCYSGFMLYKKRI